MHLDKVLDESVLDDALLSELDGYISTLEGDLQEQLIHVLHKAQLMFGYLPPNLQRHIAIKLQLPSSHVNGVVTFYSFFNEEPMGKYTVSVCMGTACFVKGADKVLDMALKQAKSERNKISEDGLFTIKDVRCIGACGLAPVLTVNEKVYGNVEPKEMRKIIKKHQGERHED